MQLGIPETTFNNMTLAEFKLRVVGAGFPPLEGGGIWLKGNVQQIIDDDSRFADIQLGQKRGLENFETIHFNISPGWDPDSGVKLSFTHHAEEPAEGGRPRGVSRGANAAVVAPPTKCTKCSTPLLPGKRFCLECGQKVEIPVAAPAPTPAPVAAPPQKCTKCSTLILPGKKFCLECGQKVENPTPVASPAPVRAAAPAPAPFMQKCNKCGVQVIQGKKFCLNCGNKLETTLDPEIAKLRNQAPDLALMSPSEKKKMIEDRARAERQPKTTPEPQSPALPRTGTKDKLVSRYNSAVTLQAKTAPPKEVTKTKGGILRDSLVMTPVESEPSTAPSTPGSSKKLNVTAQPKATKKDVVIIQSDVWGPCRKERGIQSWVVKDPRKPTPVPVPVEDQTKLCEKHVHVFFHALRDTGPYHIYYWFGKKSDKPMAHHVANQLVPGLDELFGGRCTHHREIEEHESGQFLALFKKEGGVTYVDEQGNSSFSCQDLSKFEPKLLHCKGKRNVSVTPVPVSYKSLNSGDVFILDTGLSIYCWNGVSASRAEKATSIQTTLRFRDSRGGKPAVLVLEEGKEPGPFWDALGGKGPIMKASDVEDDEAFERQQEKDVKLYHVTDADGTLRVTHIAVPPLQQMMLNGDDCHILDIGTEIFVWIGRGCTDQERESAMDQAQAFLTKSGRPEWIPITRFLQGSEGPTFQSQFQHWTDYDPPAQVGGPDRDLMSMGKEKKSVSINMDDIITRAGGMQKIDASHTSDADKFDTDGGPFKLHLWRIDNFELSVLPDNERGVFYSGDSYVAYFAPDPDSKASPIVYFWLGRHSSSDEKGAAALHATKLAGGQATHCRVTQGKEPPHFVNLFKGKMVVRDGGVASGFNTLEEETKLFEGEPELFHVKGSNERDTRAVQVALECQSLNSADSFVLNVQGEKRQFLWFGNGCEEIEKEYATKAAAFLRETSGISDDQWTIYTQEEGEEKEEFFTILGGKTEYLNAPELSGSVREPRLFQCSNASGQFGIEEIFNFSQEDLALDDIFLLDTFHTVYVWVGPESNEEEKQLSFETALEYVSTCARFDGRDEDTPVVCTVAGYEPPMFTCWFQGWDASAAGKDNLSLLMDGLSANDGQVVASVEDMLSEMNEAKSGVINKLYPYSEIRRDTGKPLPSKYIDGSKLELYLTDEDFEKLFKMTKEKWNNANMPDWKRRKLKGSLYLF